MSVKPRPLNSLQNQRIRDWIIQQIPQCDYYTLDRSVFKHKHLYGPSATYYDATNVLLKIQGRRPETLLISAHYDSVSTSFGATDDGIAIGSMLTVMDKLGCQELEYSLLFNFNNGEESGLLGAYALLDHPWIQNVTGFINLEGTGSALNYKPLQFRSNSQILTHAYSKTRRPHLSIIAALLMSFVQSETDYKPYTTVGGLQGIDTAFYSKRYVYHTFQDTVQRVSVEACQTMTDNLYDFIQLVFLDQKLARLPSSDASTRPDFVFHDFSGLVGFVARSQMLFLAHWVVLIVGVYVVFYETPKIFGRQGIHLESGVWYQIWASILISILVFGSTIFGSVYFAQRLPASVLYGSYESIYSGLFFSILFFTYLCSKAYKIVRPLDTSSFFYSLQIANTGSWLFLCFLNSFLTLWNLGGFYVILWFATAQVLFLRWMTFQFARFKTSQHWRMSFALIVVYVLLQGLPIIMCLDMLSMLQHLVPLVAENVPPHMVVGLLSVPMTMLCFGFMPFVRKLPLQWMIILLGLSLGSFSVGLSRFPYSLDRPLKFMYSELYDTNLNTSRIQMTFYTTIKAPDFYNQFSQELQVLGTLDHCMSPKKGPSACYFNSTIKPNIDTTMRIKYERKNDKIYGTLYGTPDSMVCIVSAPESHLQIDPQTDWIVPSAFKDSFFQHEHHAIIRNTPGLEIQFVVDSSAQQLSLDCIHHYPDKLDRLMGKLPEYVLQSVTRTGMLGDLLPDPFHRTGDLGIRKTFTFQ
ncbi:hypothetical protein EDD86DRAFT_210977 [Gorgonomyces haynaldii]|nr:hypothetical protein EDD86DRAFT_210977 [Gorgonomyces haynaldii]